MTDADHLEETDAIRWCVESFNAALHDLGEEPLGVNPDLVEDIPFLEVFPTYLAARLGAAPFTFVMSRDLDVEVGPYSEVLQVPVVESDLDGLRALVVRVLRSRVEVTPGRLWTTIRLREPNGSAWRTLKVWGTRAAPTAHYEPFSRS